MDMTLNREAVAYRTRMDMTLNREETTTTTTTIVTIVKQQPSPTCKENRDFELVSFLWSSVEWGQ